MLKKLSSYTFVLLGLAVLLNSCKKEYESIENIDDQKIQQYLSNNNVANAIQDPEKTGFYYQVTTPGTGTLYTNTDSVRYSITVSSLLNGTEYYSTPSYLNLGTRVGYTTSFNGKAIPAILTTIKALKPGGVATIILPSYLAFGKNGLEAINVPSNEIIALKVTTYAEKQAVLDDQHITAFLTTSGLVATKDPSGVYYQILEAGTGTEPITSQSELTLNYSGRTLDGVEFQSSLDEAQYVLPQLIEGWGILKNFKKGAKVRIVVPSVLAYGHAGRVDTSTGAVLITGNASLDFTIDILDVEN
ncbi:FKBP-type peptidyl-prolyl cis-trans isomerase [Pedobacter metabolipauper]|uniref:Peptidyl-prolyl cis-trans isomerase n=1 Tax=Pedobacter metabolipauper TaxID=425513 RepID=A0A4R6T085_9SPHI|nr:FKBP-type peptidyl-prolyl cis-trans isomerase [Pedobacter metabolipauper]TDQ10235.1 FKBP-type peptidyl-prolyl isomerase-like protein [Pedobacter metabolipauper]